MQEVQGFDLIGGADSGPKTLSKRAFGEAIGVSAGRVSQLIAAGLPVEPNGRIELARGRDWYRENVDGNRRRGEAGDDWTLASAKAEREAADAKTARLKAEILAGNLIERRAALQAIESRARAERDAWIGWVNRVAPALATSTGGDLSAIVAILDREVRDQLASLARTPLEAMGDD
ncbi:hypothetical protein [Breoghania sp. L-A4]|uniref:hypothetical protein n=1 Tax=Breoghania sp. L-A4 TaxID=2304600 RepID=UPI000E35F137|nr:hypothetical protein [Breoghania sp. L-A4]AXS39706.1 hypothetical protein D1F64_06145 [Breoghania sp. L-A4]